MRTLFGLAALLGGLLAGCGAPMSLTQTVGPDGATLELPGGLSLEIPAGALGEDTEIGVELLTSLDDWAAMPDFASGLPAASVSLTPHGTTFAAPVTLTLPFETAEDLVLVRASEPGAAWEATGPFTRGDGVMTIPLTSFSGYALIPPGTCPCFTGANLREFYAHAEARAPIDDFRKYIVDDVSLQPPQRIRDRDPNWNNRWPDERLESIQVGWVNVVEEHAQVGARWLTEDGQPAGQNNNCYVAVTDDQFGDYVDWDTPNTADPSSADIRYPVDEAEFRTCRALMMAGFAGETSHQVGIYPEDVPVGETATLNLDGREFTVGGTDVTYAPGLVVEGEAWALSVTTQPASATCTLDTTSGVMGTTNMGVVLTCTTACSGPDTDGDGVPDACDPHPNTACSVFDLSAAEETLAFAGAQCLVGATGAALPATLQGEADSFTGVFVQHTADSWEIAGAVVWDSGSGPETFVPYGCADEAGTFCTDNTRPQLPADSTADQSTYDACLDVAEYACR